MEDLLGREVAVPAKPREPARPDRNMPDLLLIDVLQDRRAADVAGAFEPCRHLRRHVEPARFKNERHNGKPRQQVVGGRRRRFPKPVMGRQIAISRTEIGKPRRQQFEMGGLLGGDLDPIVEEVARQPSPAKRATISQPRSIALSSMWASAWSSAIRPAREPKARRFGISRGGRNTG